MARLEYEILVANENADGSDLKPWTATVFEIDADGNSSDSLAVGFGASPRDAVRAALDDDEAGW